MSKPSHYALIDAISRKVADLIHHEVMEHVSNTAEAIHIAAAVSARIASSVLVGNLADASLNDDAIYHQIIESYVTLFRDASQIIRDARAEEIANGVAPSDDPDEDIANSAHDPWAS